MLFPRPHRDDGFTLVEVLVAMTLIIVGLFPILVLVDKGNTKSVTTLRREAATNLAREIVERAHGVAYTSLTATGASSAIMASVDPPPATRGASTTVGVTAPNDWSIASRYDTAQTRLQVDISSCSLFAPSTSIRLTAPGVVPCTSGGGTTTPTTPTAAVTVAPGCVVTATDVAAVGVLLVQAANSVCVSAGTQLAAFVCTLLGPTQPLDATLQTLLGQDGALSIVGTSVAANVCGGKPVNAPGTASVAEVARQVSASVTWDSGRQVQMTTVVPA